MNRHIPGTRAYLLKGERGARVGGYVIVYEFDSLGRRNEYFPRPDTTSTRWQQLARALPANAHANLARYVEIRDYTDYVVAKWKCRSSGGEGRSNPRAWRGSLTLVGI